MHQYDRGIGGDNIRTMLNHCIRTMLNHYIQTMLNHYIQTMHQYDRGRRPREVHRTQPNDFIGRRSVWLRRTTTCRVANVEYTRTRWQERAYHWQMSHETTTPSCLRR
jgi:hypothetical protein